ncbi:DeoR family transcriptional regulator [Caproiciproducens sp. R1]|uniref:DeoR family transcriptional regulator n=1 Tax=Caproiciproducens sp. R1 TaxID=3435000 RepID=UPI0040347411
MSLEGEDRKAYILSMLDSMGKVKVTLLSEELQVTPETIRRYLEELEKEKRIKRVFPLSFIKDYYQSNLVASGWLFTVNYAVSIIPFVILMNWLYYKTGRNILVAIAFHITANLFNEIFMTDPHSKVIQTLLLTGLVIFLLIKERNLFFNQPVSPTA